MLFSNVVIPILIPDPYLHLTSTLLISLIGFAYNLP